MTALVRALAQPTRRRIAPADFASVALSLAELYCEAFPKTQRRRLLDAADDDGELSGPSVQSWVTQGRGELHGYFAGQALVGFTFAISLGELRLGDYMARSRKRPDLAGLGTRMLGDFITDSEAAGQLAVVEVEPPSPGGNLGPDAAVFRERSRRLQLFVRLGFTLLERRYQLPSGEPMLLAVHTRPSASQPSADDYWRLARRLEATYRNEPWLHG